MLFLPPLYFQISNRVSSENEIKVLEIGLDFPSIQRQVNELNLGKILKNIVGEHEYYPLGSIKRLLFNSDFEYLEKKIDGG